MVQPKEIRSKISTIGSTKQITSAMELVAAGKMRRARKRMEASDPYAREIRRVISHVAYSHSEARHPYLIHRQPIQRVGFFVVTTDRGLCGGLNVNLLRKTVVDMKHWHEKNVEVDLCLLGKKGELFFSGIGAPILATASHLGDKPTIDSLIGVIKVLLDRYDEGKLDAIYIVSNQFINTMTQRPEIRSLLPLPLEAQALPGHWDYLYEPDASRALLSLLLVRYIEAQVYQAVVENIACEQAARMLAMKNATDNANELIKDLRLVYNKARQASITQEIAEIVGGATAIE